ncbi:MAG: acyl-ACP desaturase [Planctomycetota bacterium]|nr:acyl-ACP desaturase [Planctomycetota bacterium]
MEHRQLIMSPERLQVMIDLLPAVEALLPHLKTVEESWQPSDLLPDFSGEAWREDLDALRAESVDLTDEMLVVLVGNVVTEEALPSYQTALNRFGGMTDRTGTESHGWAQWSRGWTAEEKRHGDVTRAYLYLTGRVDMRSVEQTIQYLIRNGFDTRAEGDPFRGLAYVSVQEHATKTSWRQLGNVVRKTGATQLHKMCGLIAADEARHERVYRAMMKGVLDRDPGGALEALRDSLGRIVMPASRMSDGTRERIFQRFSDVGSRIGVYTLRDYADNVEGFIQELELEKIENLDGASEKRRDEICAMPARYRRQAEVLDKQRQRPIPFRWLRDRVV